MLVILTPPPFFVPQCVVRVCCIRSFGHFLTNLHGNVLHFNPEVGIFTSITQSEQDNLVQQAKAQFKMVKLPLSFGKTCVQIVSRECLSLPPLYLSLSLPTSLIPSISLPLFPISFSFSPPHQAEEEARRNRLMRDMAQLRLQVFMSFPSYSTDDCF